MENDFYFDDVIAQNSDYFYISSYTDSELGVDVYKKEDNKTLTKVSTFTNKDGVVVSLAVDKEYIVAGNSVNNLNDDSEYYGYATLFKSEDNGSVTAITSFAPDDEDDWSGFGNKVSISNNYILVGTEEDSAYLFKINSDESISQVAKLTIPENMQSDYFDGFAYSLLVKDDKIAISGYSLLNPDERSSYFVSVYRIEENDSVSLIDTIYKTGKFYFGKYIDIEDNYLVVNEPRNNVIYTYSISDTNLTEFSSKSLSISRVRNQSLAIEQGYIVQAAEGDDNISLDVFKLEDNGTMSLIRELPTGVPTYNYFSYISFYKDDIFVITPDSFGFSNSISWYDLRADDKIYFYIQPDSHIDLGEGDSLAYNFYIGSPKGPVTYTIEGDDKDLFKIENDTLKSMEPFDYENPLDFNGDNNYSIIVKVEDQAGNQEKFDMVISVYDKKYVKTDSDYIDSGLSDAGFASSNGYIYTGLWNHPKLSIFKDVNGDLEKIVDLGTDSENMSNLFGFSVVAYENYFATTAIFANNGDGIAYLYKMNSDDTQTLISEITPDQSEQSSEIRMQTVIGMYGNLLAITYKDRETYTQGWISLYSFDDNGTVKLGNYIFINPDNDSTDIPDKIKMSENYLVVVGEQKNIYINKIEEDKSLTLIDTLPDYYIAGLFENTLVAVNDTNLVLMSINDDNVDTVSSYELNDSVSSVDLNENHISVAYTHGGSEVLIINGDTISKVDEINSNSNLVRFVSEDRLITGTKSDDRIDLYVKDED